MGGATFTAYKQEIHNFFISIFFLLKRMRVSFWLDVLTQEGIVFGQMGEMDLCSIHWLRRYRRRASQCLALKKFHEVGTILGLASFGRVFVTPSENMFFSRTDCLVMPEKVPNTAKDSKVPTNFRVPSPF